MRLTLIRHSEAGARIAWSGDDAERPLDEDGMRQAAELVELLDLAPETRLLASPYLRCVQTLEPLAASLGAGVEAEEMIGELASTWTILEFLAQLLDSGLDTAVSSHGNVVPILLRGLAERGHVDSQPWYCEKGSAWDIHIGDPSRTRYLPPPR